jgi:hypothetical protein
MLPAPHTVGDADLSRAPGRHRDGTAEPGGQASVLGDLAAQLGVSRGTVRVAQEAARLLPPQVGAPFACDQER